MLNGANFEKRKVSEKKNLEKGSEKKKTVQA